MRNNITSCSSITIFQPANLLLIALAKRIYKSWLTSELTMENNPSKYSKMLKSMESISSVRKNTLIQNGNFRQPLYKPLPAILPPAHFPKILFKSSSQIPHFFSNLLVHFPHWSSTPSPFSLKLFRFNFPLFAFYSISLVKYFEYKLEHSNYSMQNWESSGGFSRAFKLYPLNLTISL